MRLPVVCLTLFSIVVAGGLTAAPAATAAPVASAATAASTTVYWGMNEARGARSMRDSGSRHINGTIGSGVQTGTTYNGSTGYTFPYVPPDSPPTHPQHLVEAPNTSTLNPGTGYWSVQVRYRTTHPFGHLVQKGQSTTSGGQFKIQVPGGRPQCDFKSSAGRDGVGYRKPLDNGHFHTLRCIKYANGVQLNVDGHRVAYKHGPIGNLSNGYPLSIGGKPYCDQRKIRCEYFSGQIDSVTITKR